MKKVFLVLEEEEFCENQMGDWRTEAKGMEAVLT